MQIKTVNFVTTLIIAKLVSLISLDACFCISIPKIANLEEHAKICFVNLNILVIVIMQLKKKLKMIFLINLADMEKQESKEVFCDLYCNRGYDCHRCSQETNEEFIGCDIRNVTDVFETDDEEVDPVTYYPCKDCDESFDDNGKLRKHFSRTHKPEENVKWLDVSFSVKKSMC